jgi:ATP-dependent Lon protease
MDDQVEELNQLGPRWFMALTLPKRVMNEMLAAVNASESEAFEKRQQEHDLEEANRRENLKSPAGPKDDLVIRYPWSLLGGDLSQLYDEQQLRNAYQKIKTVASADREKTKNRVALIEHIAARGSFRKNQSPVDWAPKLQSLRESFANFSSVIDVIEAELTLADRRPDGTGIALPPLLLNGPPGCGKTFFAEHLANLFDTSFLRISMETAQSSSDLSGSAEFWANTQPGRLFDRLIDHDHINPVVLLDEVDKAGGSMNYRADRSLYTLLERETARRWSDLSFPALQLDASHVIWVLTSNDARQIAAPLRSRMQHFDIAPLDASSARRLTRTLYRQEVTKYPQLDLDPELEIGHCDVMRRSRLGRRCASVTRWWPGSHWPSVGR